MVVVGLTARLDELAVRVSDLEADNARLVVRADNTDLRRRLGLNSKNSSKPPSSDCLDPAAEPAGDPIIRRLFDVPEVRVRVTAHVLHVLACAGCGARTRATAPAGVTGPAV